MTNSFGTRPMQGTAQSPVGGMKTRRHVLNFHLAASASGTQLPGGRLAAALRHRATIDFSRNRKQPTKPGNHKPHGADNMKRSMQNSSYEIKPIPCLDPRMSVF